MNRTTGCPTGREVVYRQMSNPIVSGFVIPNPQYLHDRAWARRKRTHSKQEGQEGGRGNQKDSYDEPHQEPPDERNRPVMSPAVIGSLSKKGRKGFHPMPCSCPADQIVHVSSRPWSDLINCPGRRRSPARVPSPSPEASAVQLLVLLPKVLPLCFAQAKETEKDPYPIHMVLLRQLP